MPAIDQITPIPRVAPPAGFNPQVLALVYEGLCAFEFGCVAEVFALPRPELEPHWYRFATCGLRRGVLRGQYGVQLRPDHTLAALAQAGTVIVPGWSHVDAPVPTALIRALRDAHAAGARLLSICSGAFVLAATGLLDGQAVATHWRYADALQARFPRVQVDADVLYVDNGQLVTSAGSAAGLDACLHLVRRDFGAAVANHVARRLVVAPHREGSQAQFVQRPLQARPRNTLAPLLAMLQASPEQPWTLEQMAAKAAMSARNLLRHFQASTGQTPAAWLIQRRLDRARTLLEDSNEGIEQIAARSGLGSAMNLRHHFRRHYGLSPRAYRARFAVRLS